MESVDGFVLLRRQLMGSTDHDEFVALLLRNQDAIYAFIKVLLPGRSDAEDVFQNVCLILWKKRDQYDPDREFIAWARGVARNEVRLHCRKSQGRALLLSDNILDQLADTQEATPPATARMHELLTICLGRLAQPESDLLKRCYSGKEKIKGIAASLAITPAALYVKLHRMRRTLLDCVKREMKREESE